jgi:peptidoglycan/xylan/chitin deacetylase (PgdA/CDA1 family)
MAFDFLLVVGLVGGAVAAGAAGWVIYSVLQEYRKDRVPALLYHHFAPGERDDAAAANAYDPVYFCYESAFDEQMNYLAREGYTTISVGEFIACQKGNKKLPPKPIILTFDDGFASNYTYAYPILKKYGMTATIFMTVDREAGNFKKYATADAPLSDAQLREMSESGIAIESHSMTHRYLSELEADVIRWELRESRASLEKLLHKFVKFLAIPSGAYNATVKRLVRETGYEAAFCMLKGSNNLGSDPYALRRLVIARDFTLDDFRRILQPGTGCFLRLTSSVQNALARILGMGGLDALRNLLYGSRLGTSLIRGQLKYVVPGLAAVIGAVIMLGLLVVSRYR